MAIIVGLDLGLQSYTSTYVLYLYNTRYQVRHTFVPCAQWRLVCGLWYARHRFDVIPLRVCSTEYQNRTSSYMTRRNIYCVLYLINGWSLESVCTYVQYIRTFESLGYTMYDSLRIRRQPEFKSNRDIAPGKTFLAIWSSRCLQGVTIT